MTMVQRSPERRKSPGEPTYVEGSTRKEMWAHFPSGAIVRVGRDRTRSYPKLAGEAPPTRAVYGALANILSRDASIIDAGCGSGAGAARLTEHFDRVVGYDSDGVALAFAREYAPLATFEARDIAELHVDAPADAAVICDVLGHLKDPGRALRKLRAALVPGGTLLVGEPAAYVGQHLSSPARRAYSKASLGSLLLRSGCEPLYFPCEVGTFMVCVAEASKRTDALALSAAEEARAQNEYIAALAEFTKAAATDRAAVKKEALLGQAEVLMQLADGDRAARALFAARELDPTDARATSGLARLALTVNQVGDALSLALEAIERDPTDALAASLAARAAERAGHADALAAWRIAASLVPDDIGVITELARSAAAVGDYKGGIAAFERLRRYGDRLGSMFHVTLAWLLFADGRVADATLEARLATTLDPAEPALAELWGALERRHTPGSRS